MDKVACSQSEPGHFRGCDTQEIHRQTQGAEEASPFGFCKANRGATCSIRCWPKLETTRFQRSELQKISISWLCRFIQNTKAPTTREQNQGPSNRRPYDQVPRNSDPGNSRVYVCMYVYAPVNIYICICIYVCMYVCICTCEYIYIYVNRLYSYEYYMSTYDTYAYTDVYIYIMYTCTLTSNK